MNNNDKNIAQSLFLWQRVTEPPSYSGIRKSKSRNDKDLSSDVSSWLQNVKSAESEQDTVEAEARAVLQEISRKQRIYADDPLCETTENRWLSSRLSSVPTRTEVKREWDHLMSEDGFAFTHNFNTNKPLKESKFLLSGSPNTFALSRSGMEDLPLMNSSNNEEDLLALDEKAAVASVMSQLKSKEFVKKSDIIKMREDWRPKLDIKEKMELRRCQLKETRQRREQEAAERRLAAEKRRLSAMESKRTEIENIRRKAAAEREEQKATEAAAEELRREELRRRQIEENALNVLSLEAEEAEMSRQRRLADEQAAVARQRAEQLFEERRRSNALRQFSIRVQTRLRREQSSFLSLCLTAWCEIVVERRLQMGHAAAWADWSLLRRSFSSWSSFTRRKIAERKAAALAAQAAAERRLLAQAETHRRRFLMQTVFTKWRFVASCQRKEKRLKEEEAHMKEKMEIFLKSTTALLTNVPSPLSEELANKVEKNSNKHIIQPPKEAWQVNDAHLTLSGAALVTPGRQSNNSSTKCNVMTTVTPAAQIASLKQPKLVNNFENRHKAQARILSEQAKIIREQAERLEELRFQQEQARLQEAALSEQRHRDLLDKMYYFQKHETVHCAVDKHPVVVVVDEINSNCEPDEVLTPMLCSASTTMKIEPKPEILRRMEERANERQRLKQERLQRRAAMEAAAREEQEAAIQAANLQLQAERRQVNLELQEKRRQLEAQRLARLEFESRQKELWHLAEAHYRLSLLRRCGMLPMKCMIKLRQDFENKAERHFAQRLLRRVFCGWFSWQKEQKVRVNALIDSFRERTLVRQCFSRWEMLRYRLELLEVRADEYASLRLTARYFIKWYSYTTESQIRNDVLNRRAHEHFQRSLLLRCFRQWCTLPAKTRALREKERRREDLRRRVQSFLPDYQPTETLASSQSFSTKSSQNTADL